jgi:murein DD-endopeptidase MepM/ murein hydrolase activator NlpD
MRMKTHTVTTVVLIIFICMSVVTAPRAEAGLIDNIKNAIKEQTDKLKNIDKEIKEYEEKIAGVREERQTLEGAVEELSSTERKLERELDAAMSGVERTESRISSLSNEIRSHEAEIGRHTEAVGEALRRISRNDDNSLVEVLLAKGTLSDFWSNVDMLSQFQVTVHGKIGDLQELKKELASKIAEEEGERAKLLALHTEIDGKQIAVEYARTEKAKLLADARGEEQTYESILEEKRALRQQFEQSLSAYEAQLQIALNPETIPEAQSSTLLWPVDNVIITQHFGFTAFAAGGAYGGKGHNGVDFGVPVGTAVKAARAGTVRASGDTDRACPNASYGRWVLVDHDNGLSTLYAHLSAISVNAGQSVTAGQVVGYSGNTGYSTGPHLHFTVYATDGMRIDNLPSRGCSGAIYTIPVANPDAYLNPMEYLP